MAAQTTAASNAGEKIFSAALLLFEQKDFDSTQISEITRNAGVAVGTFYLYYETKSQLLSAIATEFGNRWLIAWDGAWREAIAGENQGQCAKSPA